MQSIQRASPAWMLNLHLGFFSFPRRKSLGGPEKGRFGVNFENLLGLGVFSYSLGSLRDSVFRKLTRKQKSNSRLDFPRANSRSLAVLKKIY